MSLAVVDALRPEHERATKLKRSWVRHIRNESGKSREAGKTTKRRRKGLSVPLVISGCRPEYDRAIAIAIGVVVVYA